MHLYAVRLSSLLSSSQPLCACEWFQQTRCLGVQVMITAELHRRHVEM